MPFYRKPATVVAGALMLLICFCSYLLLYKADASPSPDRGFLCKTYVDAQGQSYNYIAYVPYDYKPGQKRPLILYLHGAGAHGSDGLRMIKNSLGMHIWETKRSFPFVVAIPQCPQGQSWVEGGDALALSIMDQVAGDYDTDPDRAYISGISNGGTGAWYMIGKYPDRFTAAFPLCGYPDEDAVALAASNVQIWNFYNDMDGQELVRKNRDMRQKLLAAGASPITTERRKRGHNSWSHAFRSAGLYDWLLEQSLSNNVKYSHRFNLLTGEEIIQNWNILGGVQWTIRDDHALSNEWANEVGAGFLSSEKAYLSCEFHVDMWTSSESDYPRLSLIADGAEYAGDDTSRYTLLFRFHVGETAA